MNTITDWMNAEMISALGWTIVHSLWQGAAVVAIVALLIYLFRNGAPNLRYWICLSALGALCTMAAGTFAYYYQPGDGEGMAYLWESADWEPAMLGEASFDEYTFAEAEAGAAVGNTPITFWKSLENHLPSVVTLWLLGVLLFSVRMFGELVYIQRLRRQSWSFDAPHWQNLLDLIAKDLGISRRIALRESAKVQTPTVLGYLKPIILFPVGLVNGLSGEQVESILAHELAHIKRHDYLINLLTSLVEILFFFNPAIWWLTNRIKAERENSCDDLAIELTGDAVTFVKTLAQLEDWRIQHQGLGLAITGKNGSVLGRIQRILQQAPKRPAPIKAFLSVLCVALVMGLFAFQAPAPLPEDSLAQIEPAVIADEWEVEEPLEEESMEMGEAAAIYELLAEPDREINRDSLPKEVRELEEQMKKIEAEMRQQEIALEKQEQLLRREMLEKEKAMQAQSYDLQKKLMEMQRQEQELENNMQLREHEMQMAHSELRQKELELEEQASELERKAEALEAAEDQTSIEELRKANAELQAQKTEFLKKQRELEKQMMAKEKEARLQQLELEKKAQAIEEARYLLESEMESKNREEEYKIREIGQKMEAQANEMMLLHRQLEQKYRKLEELHDQLEDERDHDEEDGDGPQGRM